MKLEVCIQTPFSPSMRGFPSHSVLPLCSSVITLNLTSIKYTTSSLNKRANRTTATLVASNSQIPCGIVSSEKCGYYICVRLPFSIEEYDEISRMPQYHQLPKPTKKPQTNKQTKPPNQQKTPQNPQTKPTGKSSNVVIICILGRVYMK